MKQHLHNPVFQIISQTAGESKLQVYAIGGFVRDIFLKRPSKDIDIVVIGNGIDFAEQVAKKLKVKLAVFKNFGTAQLKYQDLEIEFVGARKESYRLDSRKPIVENGTLEDDQNAVILLLTRWQLPCTRIITANCLTHLAAWPIWKRNSFVRRLTR
jgi:poly(A) polymerase